MGPEGFRRIALALAGVVEGAHMGHPDFRVSGRIFATLAAVKQGYGSIEAHPEVFAPEAGAWGRSGCTRVDLAPADDEAVGEALTLARQHVARKADPKRPRTRPATN